jgi:hypothetical protein
LPDLAPILSDDDREFLLDDDGALLLDEFEQRRIIAQRYLVRRIAIRRGTTLGMSIQNLISGDPFYRNRTAQFPLELRDPDGASSDLTGVELKFGICLPGSPNSPLVSKTEEDGITVEDAEAGRCLVIVPDSEMTMDPGTYQWEIMAIWPDTQKYTYGSGTFRLLPSIDLTS